jgi:hypothetical protein
MLKAINNFQIHQNLFKYWFTSHFALVDPVSTKRFENLDMIQPFSCILVQPRPMPYRTYQMQASLQIFLKISGFDSRNVQTKNLIPNPLLRQFWTSPNIFEVDQKIRFHTIILLFDPCPKRKSF